MININTSDDDDDDHNGDINADDDSNSNNNDGKYDNNNDNNNYDNKSNSFFGMLARNFYIHIANEERNGLILGSAVWGQCSIRSGATAYESHHH